MPSSHPNPLPDRVEQLFHQAFETEPGGRTAFLADACQGDEPLHRAVQDLLDAADAVENTPAWGATALAN